MCLCSVFFSQMGNTESFLQVHNKAATTEQIQESNKDYHKHLSKDYNKYTSMNPPEECPMHKDKVESAKVSCSPTFTHN